MFVLIAFHRPLLRLAVSPMIGGDETQAADDIFVYSGDGRFDRAAEAIRSGQAKHVLVLDRPATRLVRLGVIASRTEECRRELARRGVSPAGISLMPGAAANPWETMRCLGDWLQKHPDRRVLVHCDRFAGGDLRYISSRVLTAGDRQRLVFRGLADRRYDENNWWQSRTGWRAAVLAAFELAYDHFSGEDQESGPEFDPAAFERSLR